MHAIQVKLLRLRIHSQMTMKQKKKTTHNISWKDIWMYNNKQNHYYKVNVMKAFEDST